LYFDEFIQLVLIVYHTISVRSHSGQL